MKLDLINNVDDREMVMKEENKNKLLNILRKLGNVVDYMTEPMVARFYGVADGCIQGYGDRNKDELGKYGYRVYKKSEILNQQLVGLETVPNRGLRLYPIEAVVVIGMMLTESKVAEDLRNEIINELFGVSTENKIDDLVLRLYHGKGGIDAVNDAKELVKLETKMIQDELDKTKIERDKAEEDVKNKQDIINDLVYNVSLAEKRQRINQIVKRGGDGAANRWNLLYREFNLIHHKDVGRCAKNRGMSIINYIDNVLSMIDDLYKLTVKIFETDVNDLVDEWKFTIEGNRREV